VNVCCVCVILCCVLIHTPSHGVLTHICCKMMVQSICMTLHFNTFLTLLLRYIPYSVSLQDSAHRVAGVCRNNTLGLMMVTHRTISICTMTLMTHPLTHCNKQHNTHQSKLILIIALSLCFTTSIVVSGTILHLVEISKFIS